MNFINRLFSMDITRKTYLVFIGLVIFVGSVIPLVFAIGTWTPKFNNLLLREQNLIVYLLIGLYIVYLFLQKLYKHDLSKKLFLSLVFLITLVALYFKFKYIFSYEQDFYSDFRTMWNYALNIYNNGFIYPNRPQTERPLAFLVPLVQLFGTSEYVFKISNVVLIVCSSLILTYIISKTISKQAAILFLIILMCVPEIYFASLIPSHDIHGVFYLTIYIFVIFSLLSKLEKISKIKLFFYILLLTLIGLLLDIQRGTYTITILVLVLSFLLYMFISRENLTKRILVSILLITFIPFIIEQTSKTILKQNHFLVNYENNIYGYAGKFRYQHTFSKGSFGDGNIFWKKYAKELYPDDIKSLNFMSKSLMLSDAYYNIEERPQNYLLRSQRLYQLGTQGGFYYGRLKDVSKQEIREIQKFNKKWNTIFVTLYITILLFATIYFIFSKDKKRKNIVYFPIVFISLATIALLLISENQPRYLFMGWFLWSVVIVWFVDELFSKKEENTDSENKEYLFSSKGLISIVGIALVLYFLFRLMFSSSNYKLIDMSQWKNLECNEAISKEICEKAIVSFIHSTKEKYYSTLIMQLPLYPKKGNFVNNSKVFEVDKNKVYTFSTYVMSPYFRGEKISGFFDVNILINGVKVHTQHIANSKGYKYVKLENLKPNKDGQIRISLQIVSNVDYGVASWQKASRVYFKFSSLRETHE